MAAVYDFAARCEGRAAAPRAADVALRLPWEETTSLSLRATRMLAHLSVALHSEHAFTDAFATDGSFVPAATADGDGDAAWGVWGGVGVDGRLLSMGGRMPEATGIQDA